MHNSFTFLKENIKFIIICCFLFTLSGVSLSFFLQEKFTASAVLKIPDDNGKSSLSSSIGNQLSGLSAISGISLGSSSDNTDLAIEILQSSDFIEHLSGLEGISENILASKHYSKRNNELEYDLNKFDPIKKTWAEGYNHSFQEVAKNLKGKFIISKNNRTNFITVKFTHISPIFAADFIKLSIKELNSLQRKKELQNSKKALEYLYSQLRDTVESDIRLSINRLIEVQLNKQMLANVQEDYLLEYIDNPYIPEKRSSPRRSLITLLSFMMGLFFSVFILLFRRNILANNN
jgi:LPS O-antigen subunit length determinant protein (WzzB/FepE family)